MLYGYMHALNEDKFVHSKFFGRLNNSKKTQVSASGYIFKFKLVSVSQITKRRRIMVSMQFL